METNSLKRHFKNLHSTVYLLDVVLAMTLDQAKNKSEQHFPVVDCKYKIREKQLKQISQSLEQIVT